MLSKAVVSIKGNRPMLFHRFGPDSIPLEKREKTGVSGNDPEEWRRTVLATSDGRLYVEASYIFGCLRQGAKFTKKGKSSLQATLAATLLIGEDKVFLTDCTGQVARLPNGLITPPETNPELPVYLDVRGVVNPSTRGRNVRYRVALAAGWQCEFPILWDRTIVSAAEMESVVRDSGVLVGLSNGRTIGFGRFDVLKFEVK